MTSSRTETYYNIIYWRIQCNLSKLNLLGTKFCVGNRQVFGLPVIQISFKWLCFLLFCLEINWISCIFLWIFENQYLYIFVFGWIFINLYGVALIILKWDYDLYICAAEEDTHIFFYIYDRHNIIVFGSIL